MAKIITKETKPGKGIDKDAPEKRRFFLFFEIFGAKISKLIQLNFIYFLMLIPLIAALYFSFNLNPAVNSASDILKYPLFFVQMDWICYALFFIACIVTGPATAGFVFVLRNIQRREHTWIFSDFFAQFKKNFKQGVAMSFLDFFCYLMLYVAMDFYLFVAPGDALGLGNAFPTIAAVFVFSITFVYTWAHYYIYTMMVTFDLKFSKLFKNALIFALAKPFLNIFISVLIIGIVIGMLYLTAYVPIVSGIIIPIIFFSLIGFIVVFSTYPTIDKVMIQKAKKSTRILNTRDY